MRGSKWRARVNKVITEYSPANRSVEKARLSMRNRFLQIFWSEVASSCGAECEDLGSGFRKFSRDGEWTIAHHGNVMLDSNVMLRVAGNKPLLYRLLSELDVSMPDHVILKDQNWTPALRLMEHSAVVVKPASGTGSGIGVVTNIDNEGDLSLAVEYAFQFSENVLVEPYVQGHSYRLLYLNGNLIDAVLRKPPGVIGDGTLSLKRLIEAENTYRIAAEKPSSLSLVTLDRELRQHLNRRGIELSDVPPSGNHVVLKNVVNQNNRLENERVLDRVHNTTAKICSNLCSALGVELAGVDLILPDIEKDWHEQPVLLNEINTTPGLHHHVLTDEGHTWSFVGKPLLEYLLTRRQSHDVTYKSPEKSEMLQ